MGVAPPSVEAPTVGPPLSRRRVVALQLEEVVRHPHGALRTAGSAVARPQPGRYGRRPVLCLVRNDAQIAQTELDVLALGLLLVQHARLARSVSKFAGACRWGPGDVDHGGDYCEQQQRNGG